MTSLSFAIVLSSIAFVTGLMSFSEDIAKNPDLKFVDKLWFKVLVLFVATVTTFICTKAYNNYTDTEAQIKLNEQITKDSTNQNKRDSFTTAHLDSVIAQNEQRLINSSLYYDSSLKRYIRDSTKAKSNSPEPEISFSDTIIAVDKFANSTYNFRIQVMSRKTAATNVSIAVGVVVNYKGSNKVILPLQLILDNEVLSPDFVRDVPIDCKGKIADSAYFFYIKFIYSNNEGDIKHYETVLKYNPNNGAISYLLTPYKEQMMSLFKKR